MRMINTALALSIGLAAALPAAALAQDIPPGQVVQTVMPVIVCLTKEEIARAAHIMTYTTKKRTPADIVGQINAEYGDNSCVAAQIQFREIAVPELVSDGTFAHRLRHIEIVAVYSPVLGEWNEFPIRYPSYVLTQWCLRVAMI